MRDFAATLWRRQVAVAPLPEKTQFDRKLTAELNNTLLSQQNKGGVFGLAEFLDAAITTQKIALDSLVNVSCIGDSERRGVERYLEDNTELLDSCNYFVERVEGVNKCVDTLRVVAHLVDGCNSRPNSVAAKRALKLLESCWIIEKRCKVMSLKKLMRKKLCHDETDLGEIMCGSKAMAMMCCRFLEIGLTLDSKRGGLVSMKQSSQPVRSSWLRLLEEKVLQKRRTGIMIDELQQTVSAARELKEHMKGKREKEMKSTVERLKKSCRGLEDGIEIVEGRVKDLYRSLIDVRMALLGILSQA